MHTNQAVSRSVGFRTFLLSLLILLPEPGAFAQESDRSTKLPRTKPEAAGMRSDRLERIDRIVAEGLRRKLMPGCVVLVARKQRIVWLKAYGAKRLKPNREPMTVDTVFDMASITKPMATATSVMKLVEDGKIALDAPVAKYIPEFGANGKEKVTVLQLLTHQGGLIPDNSIRDYNDGTEEAFRRIYNLKFYVQPGTKFVYTDVGFIVLADLVKRVSGRRRPRVLASTRLWPTGYVGNGIPTVT